MLSQPQGPLPDHQFIANNIPVPRPAPLTTCTKEGKAAAAKKRKGSNKEGTKEGKAAVAKKTEAVTKPSGTKKTRAAAAKKNA
jgi:hypothetical protein